MFLKNESDHFVPTNHPNDNAVILSETKDLSSDSSLSFRMTESGRSMVEMFAVLAIIGIITLGGLAGYRTAIRRLHANKIGEYIAALSTEAQIHNKTVNLSNLDDYDMTNPPECINGMTGYKGGEVRVMFDTTQDCEEIKQLVRVSFSKCKFEAIGSAYYYVPYRGEKCNETKCSGECESFTPES